MNINMRTFLSYIFQFSLEWKTFQIKVVEKIKTYTLCSKNICPKIVPFWDKMEKYYKAGQSTDDNMAHAHCILAT
jgi:hypothetical protein